jgi:hypothetical protein
VSVSISAVIPTSQDWPEIQPCLDALFPEARELGAEVIVLDPHGRGLPADAERRYPGIVHLTEPGASILRMRQTGLIAARGDVVAITEDHCEPPPGWLSRHLAAHDEHPEFAAVGGPVTNGATGRLVDWAIFLQNHARWFPPLPSGERRDMDRSNASYKRRVLPSATSPGGWDEPFFDEQLIERGERFWLDAGNALAHTQSLGLWGTIAIEFHVGRAVGGLQARHGLSRRQRLWRVATSPLIAAVNLREVLRVVLGRRVYPRRALASLALIVPISVALAAGFVTGYAAGPGNSTDGLR